MYFSMLPCYNTFAKTFFIFNIKLCLVPIHLKVPFGLHSAVGILGICKTCMFLILHYLTNIQTSIPICKIKFALFVPFAPFAVLYHLHNLYYLQGWLQPPGSLVSTMFTQDWGRIMLGDHLVMMVMTWLYIPSSYPKQKHDISCFCLEHDDGGNRHFHRSTNE